MKQVEDYYGPAIAFYRNKKDISQLEMFRQLIAKGKEITYLRYSRIEKGEERPGSLLPVIADILEVKGETIIDYAEYLHLKNTEL